MDKIDLTKKGVTVEKVYKEQRDKGTYNEIFKKYKDPATKYSFYVLEGKEIAGEMTKLDCFRHLNDLARAEENIDDFPYYYDLDKCRNILNFAAICPDVNMGKPLPLMLWQQSFLCKCVGWRNKKDNYKRYSRVILSVARTNGKTYLANILTSYSFLVEADEYSNQDMGYIAPVSAQTDKGFRYLRTTFNYLKNIPAIGQIFQDKKIRVVDDKIASSKNENKLLKLSQEGGQFDSYHFLFCVVDEVGDDKHLGVIKTNSGKITSGQVQTPNHQTLNTSTAYPDSNSILYSDEKMLKETMQRDYERLLDDYLCVVYEQDSTDETSNPKTWIKSNPVLSLSGKESMLTSLISERDTFTSQGKIQEFQNKNLNLWLATKQNSYLDLDDIEKAVVKEPPISIKGRKVYIGWDLAHFSDDIAIVFVFPYTDNKRINKFYIYEHSWVPLARAQNNITIKERMDGIDYRKAESLGFATIADNPYGYIDENMPYEWMMEFIQDNQLDVQYFNYDAYQSEPIVLKIDQQTEIATMPIRQGTRTLNSPTTYFRKMMDMNRITYLDDPMLIACLKNALLFSDNNGVKIDKDKATAKIDCSDAIIDAFETARLHFEDVDAVKEKESNKPFAGWSEEKVHDYFQNYSF